MVKKGCSDDEVDELSEKEFRDSPSEEEPSREQSEEESDDEPPGETVEEDDEIEDEGPPKIYDEDGEEFVPEDIAFCAEEDLVGVEYVPGEEECKPSPINDHQEEELNWCIPSRREKRRRKRKY